MKIAVASTGLGHVARGIEAWAKELARNIAQSDVKIDVTLFGAEPFPGSELQSSCGYRYKPIKCLKRGDWIVRLMAQLVPGWTWRWGWKSTYAIEQMSFAKRLVRILRQDKHDLIHTQDPVLAIELERAKRRGIINTPVILAHGTADSPEFLKEITYLQHLCLEYQESFKVAEMQGYNAGGKSWVIPNFVDTKKFSPKKENMIKACPDVAAMRRRKARSLREDLGIPSDSLVIGCSAALKFSHKRLDYLIREVASLNPVNLRPKYSLYLLLAGAVTDETPQVEKLAKELLGDSCKILKNVPLDQMPDFYRALDIYIHPSHEEFYGVSILEALASGLPVVANLSPSLNEQVFAKKYLDIDVPAGGVPVDMKAQGSLRALLEQLNHGDTEEWIGKYGKQARERAEKLFSWEAVEPRFLRMYEEVIEAEKEEDLTAAVSRHSR